MQITLENPRYEGLHWHMAQKGLHLARNGLAKPKFGLHQVCEWCETMLRCSDIIRDNGVIWLLFHLPKRSVALAFCLAQSLPSSSTKFVYGLHQV